MKSFAVWASCMVLGAGFVFAPELAARTALPQEAPQARNFVRVKEAGAKLTNLADKNAEVVLKPAAGTVLEVFSKNPAGYLEVAAPGGLEVWVYGEYVTAASEPGMLEITANGVGLRPLPSSDQKSFRLGQSLSKGEKVRFLARHDPAKPIKEDWVRIVSPTRARAWILESATQPLAAGEDGATLFGAAERAALASAPVVDVPREALQAAAPTAAAPSAAAAVPAATAKKDEAKPAAAPAAAAATTDALAKADQLMEAARKAENPDFGPVKAAYKKVLDANPSSQSAETARVRLQEIEAREELQALKADARSREAGKADEIARKQAELQEASLYQDPLWGRFQARGWLERDGERFVVRWANKRTMELACTSKRYELAKFVGFEVGVMGVNTRAVQGSGLPVLDVSRLEVLSGAGARR